MPPVSELILWTLVMVRASGLIAGLPIFSTNNVPKPVKGALGMLLAVLTTPMLPSVNLDQTDVWSLSKLLLIELSIGYLLGFICRFIFFALDIAGSIVANDLGLSMATMLNPASNAATPVISTLFYWMGVMLVFALDMHHWILAAFVRSYSVLPVGGAHLSEALLEDISRRTSWILSTGLQLSAPVMAASFVITLVFALLGRAVPQMNVFTESMPIRTAGGLAILGLSISFIGDTSGNFIKRIPDDMLNVAKILGGG